MDVTITTDDGTTLTAANDLALAWVWARHVYGTEWDATPYSIQVDAAAIALKKIREAPEAN